MLRYRCWIYIACWWLYCCGIFAQVDEWWICSLDGVCRRCSGNACPPPPHTRFTSAGLCLLQSRCTATSAVPAQGIRNPYYCYPDGSCKVCKGMGCPKGKMHAKKSECEKELRCSGGNLAPPSVTRTDTEMWYCGSDRRCQICTGGHCSSAARFTSREICEQLSPCEPSQSFSLAHTAKERWFCRNQEKCESCTPTDCPSNTLYRSESECQSGAECGARTGLISQETQRWFCRSQGQCNSCMMADCPASTLYRSESECTSSAECGKRSGAIFQGRIPRWYCSPTGQCQICQHDSCNATVLFTSQEECQKQAHCKPNAAILETRRDSAIIDNGDCSVASDRYKEYCDSVSRQYPPSRFCRWSGFDRACTRTCCNFKDK